MASTSEGGPDIAVTEASDSTYDPRRPLFRDGQNTGANTTVDEDLFRDMFNQQQTSSNGDTVSNAEASSPVPANDDDHNKDYIPLNDEDDVAMEDAQANNATSETAEKSSDSVDKSSRSTAQSVSPVAGKSVPTAQERAQEDELDEINDEGTFRYGRADDGARLTNKPPEPIFFLQRKAGLITPLIAVDELPTSMDILMVPRTMAPEYAKQNFEKVEVLPGLFPRSAHLYEPTYTNEPGAEDYNSDGPGDFDFGGNAAPEQPRFGRSAQGGGRDHSHESQDDENFVPKQETWMDRMGPYKKMLSEKWAGQGRVFPGSRQFGAFPNSRNDSGQVYNPLTPGVFGRKIFCSHWIRTGECDFTQQGCNYLHIMPDLKTMELMNMKSYPRWFRELPREIQAASAAEYDPAGHIHADWRQVHPSERSGRSNRDGPRGKSHAGRGRGRGDKPRRPNPPRTAPPSTMPPPPPPNPHFVAGHYGQPWNPMIPPQSPQLAQPTPMIPAQSPYFGQVAPAGPPQFGQVIPNIPPPSQHFAQATPAGPPAFGHGPHFVPSRAATPMGHPPSPLLSVWSETRVPTPSPMTLNTQNFPHQGRTRQGSNASNFSHVSNLLEFETSSQKNLNAWTPRDNDNFAKQYNMHGKRASDFMTDAIDVAAVAQRKRARNDEGGSDNGPDAAAQNADPAVVAPKPVCATPFGDWNGANPVKMPPKEDSIAHLHAQSNDAEPGAKAIAAAIEVPLPGPSGGADVTLDYGDGFL